MPYARTTWVDYPATTTEITAARLNNIETGILAVEAAVGTAAWSSFTPQLRTGTTNITSTNNYGRYITVGNTITVQAKVTATQAGSASGAIKLSNPTGTSLASDQAFGVFFVKDTGTAYYTGVAMSVETGYISGQAYNSVDSMGANTPAMTIAVGDIVSYSIVYSIV